MEMTWMTLALMACTTFYCRYAFFTNRLSFTLGGPLKRLLDYTAPSVMTAMWAPIVFLSDGQHISRLDDPFLLAGIGTVALSLLTRHTLLVVLLGFGLFIALRHMLPVL